jgi:hypothetical protein
MSKSATGGAAPASAGGGQPTAPGQQTPPGQPAPPPPAPAAGGHTPPLHSVSSTAPLIPGVEGEIPEGVDDDLDVLKGRRQIGYAIGCLGILGIIATLAVSLWSLHVLAEPTKEFEVFAYVKMGAHAVLTVAAVWFCYQMLRAVALCHEGGRADGGTRFEGRATSGRNRWCSNRNPGAAFQGQEQRSAHLARPNCT